MQDTEQQRHLILGLLLGVALAECVSAAYRYWRARDTQPPPRQQQRSLQLEHPPRVKETSRSARVAHGVVDLIGNTPLVRLNALSDATGCEILAKAEHLNPGGSPKDRVALSIIRHAELDGLLGPPCREPMDHKEDNADAASMRSVIFEGTVGSTGISLAMIARALGYGCHIVVPDDQAREKYALLERHGATVERVRPASIIDRRQFVNAARARAQTYDTQAATAAQTHGIPETQRARGFFADQFENLANFQAHYETTGPEIWQQTGGKIDAFVAGAGTGGTIAGVARYLKRQKASIHVTLADPPGSGLFHKVRHGVFYSPYEAEGTRRRHQVDTVVEGVGVNRLTRNFAMALPTLQRAAFRDLLQEQEDRLGLSSSSSPPLPTTHWDTHATEAGWIDDAIRVTDAEAVAMSRYLVDQEGLFVGSSSAVNCVGAVRLARRLGPGHTIVTLLCDSGQRHLTKFWSDAYLEQAGIAVSVPTRLDFIQ